MIQEFFTVIFAGMLFVSISGCDIGEISEYSQDSEINTQTPLSQKETDPININIDIKTERYQYNKNEDNKVEDIKLDISFDFLNPKRLNIFKSKSAKVVIETDNIIEIKGNKEYYYPDVKKITDKTIPIDVVIPYDTEAHGEIRAHLYTYDENGNQLYYRSTPIYYSIKDEEMLLGFYGTSALRRKHLDNLLERGKINEVQHKRVLEFARSGEIFFKKAVSLLEDNIKENDKNAKIKIEKTKIIHLGGIQYAIEISLNNGDRKTYDISTPDIKIAEKEELRKLQKEINDKKTKNKNIESIWIKTDSICQDTTSDLPTDEPITNPEDYETEYIRKISKNVENINDLGEPNIEFNTTGDFKVVNGVEYTNHCSPTAATNMLKYWYERDNNLYSSLYDNNIWKDVFVDINYLDN